MRWQPLSKGDIRSATIFLRLSSGVRAESAHSERSTREVDLPICDAATYSVLVLGTKARGC